MRSVAGSCLNLTCSSVIPVSLGKPVHPCMAHSNTSALSTEMPRLCLPFCRSSQMICSAPPPTHCDYQPEPVADLPDMSSCDSFLIAEMTPQPKHTHRLGHATHATHVCRQCRGEL